MKILVVDDETLICEWLEFCVRQSPGCELAGVANNGRDALQIFMDKKPDVVFTDIKMPVMDGLDLLRKIKEQNHDTIVVMLTAFSEFDLAREALHGGADNYILKTEMSRQKFEQVIEDIRKTIDKRQVSNSGHSTGSDWRRQPLIRDTILTSDMLDQDQIERLKAYGVRWRNSGLFALAFWKDKVLGDFIFPQDGAVRHVAGFEYDQKIYIMVANLPREVSAKAHAQMLERYVQQLQQKNSVMVGVSRIIEDMRKVRSIVEEAAVALSIGFYSGNIQEYRCDNNFNKTTSIGQDWERSLRKFYQEFHEASVNEQREEIEKAIYYIENQRVYPLKLITQFFFDIIDEVYARHTSAEDGLNKVYLQKTKQNISSALTWADMRKEFEDYLDEYLWNKGLNENQLTPGVHKALDFMRTHYAQPISLEHVAQEVQLNPEYLSRLFRKEVGCTYSAYLTDIRMRHAARMLIKSSERVQTIGQQVGYPNVSYFSTLFKKKYGANPFEYRRGNQNDAQYNKGESS